MVRAVVFCLIPLISDYILMEKRKRNIHELPTDCYSFVKDASCQLSGLVNVTGWCVSTS